MYNPIADFYRRAATVAYNQDRPDLAVAAQTAASALDPTFSIGNVQRPQGRFRARSGFVGQSSTSIPTGSSSTPVDQGSGPPYPCPHGMDPNTWDFNNGCPIDGCSVPVTQNCDTPRVCNYNIIGSNTLGTDGIDPGATGRVVFTAGDAGSFTPKFFYYEALPVNDQTTVDISLLPDSRSVAPCLLQDVLIGRTSQLRRGGSANVAIPQGAYAATKEIVPVDWAKFTSTQEQNLVTIFNNPNSLWPIHVFVCLWGDI